MTRAKQAKLSSLGKQAERLLAVTMKEMEDDAKHAAKSKNGTDYKPKFSLTDRMKVIDRAAKFEAIRAKMDDPEGSFFSGARKGEDDDESE